MGRMASSSLRFVQYGLDRGDWLALILDIAGVLADWNRSDMHLTSGVVGVVRVRRL